MEESNFVKVGISVGDLAGIGPEIIMKTFEDKRMLESVIPIIYCSQKAFSFHQKLLRIENFQLFNIRDASEAKPNKINLVQPWTNDIAIEIGVPSREIGACAFKSLEKAVQDLARNVTDVLVTAPINKDTIQSDDFNFPGHTEYLADYSNADDVLMLLVHEGLRVAVATGHIPLKEVASKINRNQLHDKIALLHSTLSKDFGVRRPRIAVMGLNPHAGEQGRIGEEEQQIISPAIKLAQQNGMMVFGPYPADGLFGSANYKNFDGILAMYHDQGLTPFKALAFDSGVNFTAGLPIVRTSPDHGTAYDIAGNNEASPTSFRHAVYTACDIFNMRKLSKELATNPLPVR